MSREPDSSVPSSPQGFDRERIEAVLGREFNDLSLLEEAFTHQSYANGKNAVPDNQRLEFLGDAVLDLLAADALFREFPQYDEGVLTAERSRLVSGDSLAAVAREFGLGAFMRFSKGVRNPEELHGVRTLAALAEAVFGATWLDGGLPAASALFDRFIKPRLPARDARLSSCIDPRGELQTHALRAGLGEPVYSTADVETDGCNFTYRVVVTVGGISATASAGNTRKACAAAALAWLEANKHLLDDENNHQQQ